MKALLVAFLAVCAASCSPEKMTEDLVAKNTPAALTVQAQSDISRLSTEGQLKLRPPVKQVGYHWNKNVGEPTTAQIVYESAPDAEGKVMMLGMNYVEINGSYKLQGFETQQRQGSALSIPPFRLSDGSPMGWLAAIIGLSALAISLVATVAAVRTKGLKRKWLWVVGCVLALGNFKAGWASGAFDAGFGVQFLGFGATAMVGATEWVIAFGIPVFAVLFLWKRANGTLSIVAPLAEPAA